MPTDEILAEKAAAHTPAPWFYYCGQHSVYSTAVYPERSVCHISGPRGADAIRAAERDADGRLIAAAPALLEALKTTAGNIRSLGPAGALKTVPMEYREWLRVVDEAIAKAEHR